MKRFACHYAIIRFLPYPETQEFANVGVVLACPESGYFGFKLEKRRHGRITDFFTEIDGGVYRQAMSRFEDELNRIAKQVQGRSSSADEISKLFHALVHPREAIVRFGEARVLLAEDLQQSISKLFDYYVRRDFVTHEYKEKVLFHRVKSLLDGLDLPAPFREKEIGDGYVRASFPLVQSINDQVVKIIKPFFLAQDEPNKILKHGGLWLEQLKFLKRRELMPQAVMFAVEGPGSADGLRFEAFEEICNDLRGFAVEVFPAAQEQKIKAFATA